MRNPSTEVSTNLGYVLGRLYALRTHIEQVATGESRWTDSNYAMASSRPAWALAVAERCTIRHLRMIRNRNRNGRAMADRYGHAITDIVCLIDISCGLPDILNPHDSGLFGVGFHNQRYGLLSQRSDSTSTPRS